MKNKHALRLFFAVLMMLASLGAWAQYVVSTGDHVRLRTGPSTSAPMLVWNATGKAVWINKGDRLVYLGYNDTPGFYNVQFDGKSVYISKQFSRLVYPNSGYTTSSATVVVVNGTNVRLRWSPSLSGAIYSNGNGRPIYPRKGARLAYLGQTGNWFKVRYNGNVLYISKDYAYLR